MHTIPRIHIKDITLEQFLNDYEAPKKPVIIQGLLDDWPAQDQWQPEKLLQRMPDAALKVGADDDGYPVRMKLKHYLMYITDKDHGELDDSPLYIFDGTFSDKKGSKTLSTVRFFVPPAFGRPPSAYCGKMNFMPHVASAVQEVSQYL
jgi:histone arginine demethylase JMJD6